MQDAALDAETVRAPATQVSGFEMIALHQPALAAVADLNGWILDSALAINKEWASFVNRRLTEDRAVAEQLAGCKTAHDVWCVYGLFTQNAWAHYQAQFERMTQLSRTITQARLGSMQSHSTGGTCRRH